MNDEPVSDEGNAAPSDPPGGGRRQGDRRKAQAPFEGPDRRKGDRRTGDDRRAAPRHTDDAPGDD